MRTLFTFSIWSYFKITKVWKIGTLKGLFRRAFLVSSTDESLKTEIDYLKKIFVKINNYPKIVVENTLKLVRDKVAEEKRAPIPNDVGVNVNTLDATSGGLPGSPLPTFPHIILLYKGLEGEQIRKSSKVYYHQIYQNMACHDLSIRGKN